jgi:hypothetical protein
MAFGDTETRRDACRFPVARFGFIRHTSSVFRRMEYKQRQPAAACYIGKDPG